MEYRHHFRTDVPYEARCVMRLPDDAELAGLRVVDLWCRRGKGAFLIADRVGPHGSVVGVDPLPANVEAAGEGAVRSRTDAWPAEVRFVCADPAMVAARPDDPRVAPGSADLVVANAALNLAPDVPAVLAACARMLAPGGRLWLDALVRTDGDAPVRATPADDPVFVHAPTWPELRRMLRDAGFVRVTFEDREPQDPGFERGIISAWI